MNKEDQVLRAIQNGFVYLMIEDKQNELQDRECSNDDFNIIVTPKDKEIIKGMLLAIIKKLNIDLNLSINDSIDLGGNLYIGLVYDSYTTPLENADFDYYVDLSVFPDDNVYIHGYFLIAGTTYTL